MDGELLQMPISPYGTNNYEKFAILLNSPGQVYTIGSRYSGRIENEEFVQCSKNMFLWKTHLQIKVDENREFWVCQTPIISDDKPKEDYSDWCPFYNVNRKISILNGNILGGDWERLHFGDVLSLFSPHQFEFEYDERYSVNESYLPVFYFKKITHWRVGMEGFFPREDEIVPVSPKFLPHENDLILARIFTFLESHELKKCRMVSKRWRDLSAQPLRGKLYPLISWKKMDLSHPITGLKLFYYSETFKHLKPKNLRLRLPNREKFIKDAGSLERLGRYNKFCDDIQHFLINSDLQIEDLHLSGKIKDNDDAKMWENILQKFSKGLRHLYIQCFSVSLKEETEFVIDFPNLKKFTLNCPLPPMENNSSETFYKSLAKSVENIENLEIRFGLGIRDDSVLPLFLNSFQPKNLTTVNFTTLTRLQLTWLLKLEEFPLKNLSLGYSKESDECPGDFEEGVKSVPNVEVVVSKFSKTLERLRLVLWVDKFTLTFPVLLRLRYLYLDALGKDFDIQWQDEEFLLFSKHLPVIEKIVLINQTYSESLGEDKEERDYDFFRDDGNLLNRHFFDRNMSEGCKTLRHFEFTYGCQDEMGVYDWWSQGQRKTFDEFITKLIKLEFWSLNGERLHNI